MRINLLELKLRKLIRKIIIKEDALKVGHDYILNMDEKGKFFTVDKEGNIREGIHSESDFFKNHFLDIGRTFKKIYHENTLLIELNDDSFRANPEEGDYEFSNIEKNEIKNKKINELISANPGKKIIIFHPYIFESGEELFKNYIGKDKNNIKYNVGFWLLHDIGHSIVDNDDTLQSSIRNLENFLRENLKNHPLQNAYKQIVFFIAEKMKITQKELEDFHSNDYTDMLQNFIFISFSNLENNLKEINFSNFLNFFKDRIEKKHLDELKEINKEEIKEYFSTLRTSIENLVEKIKKDFKKNENELIDKQNVTLIGISKTKLEEEKDEELDFF